MSSVACCKLHVACRMLRVACGPSLVVCCLLPPEQPVSARTHARAQRARADALVGMAVADAAVERTTLVIWALTLHWPQLPRHTLCTAAAPHPSLQSSVGLQLSQIALNCNAAEKALLADVTEALPDASYVELLRLFKVRSRRWALVARMLHLCLLRVAREHLFARGVALCCPQLHSDLSTACFWRGRGGCVYGGAYRCPTYYML